MIYLSFYKKDYLINSLCIYLHYENVEEHHVNLYIIQGNVYGYVCILTRKELDDAYFGHMNDTGLFPTKKWLLHLNYHIKGNPTMETPTIKTKQGIEPKITLVGAGPGDPDLISIKGVKALKQAQVVLYDALVDEELLGYAPAEAIKVYVGNPSGDENFSQDTVNQLMVDYALNFGHVVRLKGGDLFVFGRGYEELDYAASYSIETSIVPGISSAISVPGLQGIPVTHRGTSESLWILSATDSQGGLSRELADAARSTATVVVLLGFDHLADIVDVFQQEGKGGLPVAVIQNGSIANERIVVGLVNTIEEVALESEIDNTGPVLLVFGQAVALHNEFQKIRRFFECPEFL